ncbi:MAG: hypothetical protein J6M10_10335 [Clostridia bacterium]|nr:hypothetical protein [Clostridia bacterium]
MVESTFKQAVFPSAEPLEGYRFDHIAFVSKIELLKKAPTEDMQAWLAQHPEFKGWNSASLAAYSGLSEPTLKKLKQGQIADPRGSTFLILFKKFGVRPRDVLNGIPENVCSVECVNQSRMQLKAATQKIEELEAARLGDKAAYEKQLSDRQGRESRTDGIIDDLRRDLKQLRRYNTWLIGALVFIISVLLVIYIVWEIRNPDQGLTGLLRRIVA